MKRAVWLEQNERREVNRGHTRRAPATVGLVGDALLAVFGVSDVVEDILMCLRGK